MIGRIRADKNANGPRAALCKAIVNRDNRKTGGDHAMEDISVALDSESQNPAHNLGCLFSVYEYAEQGVAKRNASSRGSSGQHEQMPSCRPISLLSATLSIIEVEEWNNPLGDLGRPR